MADLLSVVVGGVLALGGGAGTQWYLHGLKVAEERRARRGVKFEELVSAVYDHEHWLEERRSALVFAGQDVTRMSPLSRIEGLCAIYFPEFDGAVQELVRANSKYVRWMLGEGQKRVRGAAAVEIGEGFEPVYDAYLDARSRILEELKAFGRREFR